jgi:HD-GYP domain-containing protein (c-di-GMP phosphodiesterase class II)
VAPMLVAYEHHMYADGTGLPERPADYVAHPYSRIVSIADRFENLTSATAETPALSPDRALVQILRDSNKLFDPFLGRLFANLLGPFPVGCVVRLSDQSVGVVARAGDDPLAPIVRLAFDSHGLDIEEPEDVDLSQARVKIVEIIEPGALDIDVAELL